MVRVVGKIDLRAFNFNVINNTSLAGSIIRKSRYNQELRDRNNRQLITEGYVECTQVTGGYGWAISDYIRFAFFYNERPTFSFGNDGTVQLPDGYAWVGDNVTSQALPATLETLRQACIDADDFSTYQPAIFIPRVCHWHYENGFYIGCYLMVIQINDNCTETDKTIRLHYRFEGPGMVRTD
jgi:hypothetical protein